MSTPDYPEQSDLPDADLELTPNTRVTQYVVSVLPEGLTYESRHWDVTVAYRGAGLWAVLSGGFCFDREGNSNYEHIPADGRDEWLAAHRFTQEEALALAQRFAPHITVNGYTPADILAHWATTVTPPQ